MPETKQMYSGEMVTQTVVTFCTYTHPDQTREVFPVGTYDVPVEVANSNYFMHHTSNPPPPAPLPGTAAFMQRQRDEMLTMQTRNAERAMQAAAERVAKEAADRQAIEDQLRQKLEGELRATIEAQVRAELASQDGKGGKGK